MVVFYDEKRNRKTGTGASSDGISPATCSLRLARRTRRSDRTIVWGRRKTRQIRSRRCWERNIRHASTVFSGIDSRRPASNPPPRFKVRCCVGIGNPFLSYRSQLVMKLSREYYCLCSSGSIDFYHVYQNGRFSRDSVLRSGTRTVELHAASHR